MSENLGTAYAEIELRLSNVERQSQQFRRQMDDNADTSEESQERIQGSAKKTKMELAASMGKAGAAVVAFGAVAIAALAGAVKKYSEHNSAMKLFQAQTAKTGKELKGFEKAIKSTYMDAYGESVEDVAKQYSNFTRVLGTTDKETKTLVQGAYNLNKIFEIDMNTTLQATSSLMKNYGMTGTKALDLITAATQKAGDKSDDLLDTINEYAPQFSKLGFSAEEATNMIIKGMQDGAFNTDQLADAIKEMGIILPEIAAEGGELFKEILGSQEEADKIVQGLTDGSMSSASAMKILNKRLFSMKDLVKQNELGVALYGTMWEELGADTVRAMTDSKNALGDFDGAMKKAGDTVNDSFDVEFTKFKRQLEEIVVIVGESLAPVVKDLTELMKGFSDKMGDADPKTIALVAKIAALAAIITTVVGGLMVVVGVISKVVAAVTSLYGVLSAAGTAITGFAAVLGFPITVVAAIIAAIIALIAAIVIFWDEIKAGTMVAVEAIMSVVSAWWEGVKNTFSQGMEVLKTIWQWILDLPANTMAAIQALPSLIQGILTNIANFFTTTVPFAIGYVIGRFVKLSLEAPNYVRNMIISVKNWFVNMYNTMKSLASRAVNAVVGFVKTLPSKIGSFLRSMVSKAKSYFSNLVSALSSAGSRLISKAKSIGSRLVKGILQLPKTLPSLIKNVVNRAISSLTSLGGAAFAKAKSFGASMWKGFKKGLGISSPSYIEEAMFKIEDQSDRLARSIKVDFEGLHKLPGLNTFKSVAQGVKSGNYSDPQQQQQQTNNTTFGNLLNINGLNIRSTEDLFALQKLSQQLFERSNTILKAQGLV